jgi:hypothetical protein
MGCRAVQTLAGGEVGRVIVMACETCEAIEITAALAMTKTLDADAETMQNVLMR